ncbi:hypothetical protein ACFQ1S_16975 [Kibdelosporangium lantanae]|uniref:ABC transporter permease n=1 Tax=Kibdelosporangium lantanae TaxID=1497396 RepID=A0ABW3M9B3_9PSEU
MATRSMGQVMRPWPAMLIVVESAWTWYRRNWRSTVVSSVLNPVFFLIAMGYGLGSQIQAGPVTGAGREGPLGDLDVRRSAHTTTTYWTYDWF